MVSCKPAGTFQSIPSHVHMLQVSFSPFALLCFSFVPYALCTNAAGLFQSIPPVLFQNCALYLIYTCLSLSVLSLFSVSSSALLSYVQLLQVSFSPFPLFTFSTVPYSLMYTCGSLSVCYFCSDSALCPTISCKPAVFQSIPSTRFQHCEACLMFTCRSLLFHSVCSNSALYPLSHVHLLPVSFNPFPLLSFSIVPYVSYTTDAGLCQPIPSALFQHCALCLIYTSRSLSVHPLCSVSSLCPTVSETLAGLFESCSFSPLCAVFTCTILACLF